MSHPSFCKQCGTSLEPGSQFCPSCGKAVTTISPSPQGLEPSQAPAQPASKSPVSGKVWGIDKRIIIVAIIFLVLVLPIFPRNKTVYVEGQTQVVSQSTSYATSFQTYATNTQVSIKVYKGSLQYVSDQYYQYYQQYYYQCYYDVYGNWVCYYTNWPGYQQSTFAVTVDPSDEVVKMEQTNEPGGLITITLTHYDGTSDTYRHVVSTDLTKSATATVQGTATLTNTITNTIVNPVTSTVPTREAHTEVVYCSIVQMMFGCP